MAEVVFTNVPGGGAITVTLTGDNADVNYNSEQLTEDFTLIGTDTSEVIDLQTSSNMISISCLITDLTKFNNIQAMRRAKSAGVQIPVTLKWNDDDTTKPCIDLANNTGTVTGSIAGVSLHQKSGTPSTQYDMTVKLKPNITA